MLDEAHVRRAVRVLLVQARLHTSENIRLVAERELTGLTPLFRDVAIWAATEAAQFVAGVASEIGTPDVHPADSLRLKRTLLLWKRGVDDPMALSSDAGADDASTSSSLGRSFTTMDIDPTPIFPN